MSTPAKSAISAKPPIMWLPAVVLTATFIVSITVVPWYGLTHGFTWGNWLAFALILGCNGLSITAGYHRLFAHNTYKAHALLRWFYALFGASATQNSILVWASGHRRHHRHVDDNDADPYSANRGLWFSHIGWMLRDYPTGKIDFSNVPDLQRDPIIAFQHRYYAPLAVGMNLAPPLLLGALTGDYWGYLLAAGFLRLVVNHHVTFFINSLAHYWGKQPYTDENTARDNFWLALVTYGEGYHNFHHLFQNDYRNGVRWWQWDPTKWLIAGLQLVGLTSRLKRTPDFQIQRALLAMQFKRAQEKLAKLPSVGQSQIELVRQRIANEYETFHAAIAEWARVKEQWLEEKARAVIQHWEHASFQQQLREIERRLHLQSRRLRVLHAQLA